MKVTKYRTETTIDTNICNTNITLLLLNVCLRYSFVIGTICSIIDVSLDVSLGLDGRVCEFGGIILLFFVMEFID